MIPATSSSTTPKRITTLRPTSTPARWTRAATGFSRNAAGEGPRSSRTRRCAMSSCGSSRREFERTERPGLSGPLTVKGFLWTLGVAASDHESEPSRVVLGPDFGDKADVMGEPNRHLVGAALERLLVGPVAL